MAWSEGPDTDECVVALEDRGYLVTTDGEVAKEWLENEGYLVFRDDDETIQWVCRSVRNKTIKEYDDDELVDELRERGYVVDIHKS